MYELLETIKEAQERNPELGDISVRVFADGSGRVQARNREDSVFHFLNTNDMWEKFSTELGCSAE